MWLRIPKEEIDSEFLQSLEERYLVIQEEVETPKPYDTIHIKIHPAILELQVMFWTTSDNEDTDTVLNNIQLQELLTYNAMSTDAAYNYAMSLKRESK